MTTPTFTDILRVQVALMQAQHPDKADAIGRAQARIIDGHVVDTGDGFGKVLSDNANLWYTVNGSCDCTAAEFGKACKHLAAWKLYQYVAKKYAEAGPPSLGVAPAVVPQPAPALPEAPCSVNVHVLIAGRQCQITLRGTAEADVLARLEAVLARYPAPEAPPLVAHPAATPPGASWCARHQQAMRWNEGKNGRKGWFSHRSDEGWCQGRRSQ